VSRVRFQLDEHLSTAIADALERAGADILTATDAGLCTRPDVEYIERSIADDRVIVTNDADFLRIAHHYPGHSGIIFCTQSTRSITRIIMELSLIYEVLEHDEVRGHVHHI